MRPIFCGNFEYDARQSELERLFSRYGKVDRVDMKSGKFYFSEIRSTRVLKGTEVLLCLVLCSILFELINNSLDMLLYITGL